MIARRTQVKRIPFLKGKKKIRAHGYDTEKQIQDRGRTCQSKQERPMLHFRRWGVGSGGHSFLLSKRIEAETMWIDERLVT